MGLNQPEKTKVIVQVGEVKMTKKQKEMVAADEKATIARVQKFTAHRIIWLYNNWSRFHPNVEWDIFLRDALQPCIDDAKKRLGK
jgi:hypothetical protein